MAFFNRLTCKWHPVQAATDARHFNWKSLSLAGRGQQLCAESVTVNAADPFSPGSPGREKSFHYS